MGSVARKKTPIGFGTDQIENAADGVKTTAARRDRRKPWASTAYPAGVEVQKLLAGVTEAYDPDRLEQESAKPTTLAEHYEKAQIPRYVAESNKSIENRISGSLVVAHGTGGRRSVRFRGWDQLNEVLKGPAYAAQKLRETHGVYVTPEAVTKLREAAKDAGGRDLREDFPQQDSFGVGEPADSGSTAAPNDEFHPLLLGPYQRQLYQFDFLDQASKAFEAYNHNPVAKAAVNLNVAFVMGDGVKIAANNPIVQKVVDEWIEGVGAYGLSFQDKWRMAYRDGCVIGEFFVYAPIDKKTGYPVFKLWDPTTVWEIVTDPRDIERVQYAYRQFTTQYQLTLSADAGTKPPVAVEYVIEQVPPEDWLQVKINATVGEKRGRSDLFPVLGWLKRFKDWFNAAVVSAQINNAFVIWWKINGDQSDVDAFKANADFTRVPPPGSAFFTNEAVTPTMLRPGDVGELGDTGQQLLGLIATSMNLPPEYLGVQGAGTRATALTRSEPAAKYFEQRQQLMREAISWMVRRVIACAKERGDLPQLQPASATVGEIIRAVRGGEFKRCWDLLRQLVAGVIKQVPLDEKFEVIMPDLQPEDRSATLKDLGALRVTRVISQETYASQAAELMGIDQYDFDAEQEKMGDELERGIQTMDRMTPEAPPAAGGKPENGKPGSSADDRQYRRDAKEKPRG